MDTTSYTFNMPKTRKEALANNSTQYYTGINCIYGHDSPRRAKNGQCLACRKISRVNWIKINPDKIKFYNAKYSDYAKQYYIKNKQRISQRAKNYVAQHKGIKNAATRYYQASKIKRTPKWIGDDERWIMREIYDLARLRTKQTGIKWHVDHIIPLNGSNVSGLHTPNNLQVILGEDNIRKSNRYVAI